MTPVPPIATTESLPRSIAEQLKQLIYAGEFKAGDRLNEAALAVRMGTSRGPIREAIRILTGTGLVTPVVNRGVFVRQVSLREMLEIYDLRALVFGFAAARAAENVTDFPSMHAPEHYVPVWARLCSVMGLSASDAAQ